MYDIDKEVTRLSFGSDHNKTLFRFAVLLAETQPEEGRASAGAFAPVLEKTVYPSVIWRKNLWSFRSVQDGVVFVAAHLGYNTASHTLSKRMTFNLGDEILDSLYESRQSLWEQHKAPGAKARPVGW